MCPVAEYLCPSHACLFDWSVNFNLQTQTVAPPSWTHSSVHHSRSLMIPQSNAIWLGGGQGSNFFSRRLLHLSLPLKPQGLDRLSLREKKTVKEKLHTQTDPHPRLLFLLSASLGGSRGQRVNWKSPNPPPACECCCWSWLSCFLLGRLESNFKNQNAPVGTFSSRQCSHYVDRCENVTFLRRNLI